MRAEPGGDAGNPTAPPTDPPSPNPQVDYPPGVSSPRKPRPRIWLYAVVAVVIVVVMVLGYYALIGGFTPGSGSSKSVLIPKGTAYSLPGGQLNAVTFIADSTSTLNGTFYDVLEIILYTMTPTQFQEFLRTNVLAGYEWTSGPIANETVYNLDLTVPAGAWDFVFDNPNLVNTTIIGFYTDLTLSKA